jgi:hypothetical protein
LWSWAKIYGLEYGVGVGLGYHEKNKPLVNNELFNV